MRLHVHVFLCVFHSKALLDCNNKLPHCLRPNKWKFKTSLAASPPSGLKFSFQSDFQPKWEESDSCSAGGWLGPKTGRGSRLMNCKASVPLWLGEGPKLQTPCVTESIFWYFGPGWCWSESVFLDKRLHGPPVLSSPFSPPSSWSPSQLPSPPLLLLSPLIPPTPPLPLLFHQRHS